MGRPTFMIIGAAKCGTTSIFSYLTQHPEIFETRVKEPNFFALKDRTLPLPGPGPDAARRRLLYWNTIQNRTDYDALWDGAQAFRAAGEASVRYLYCAPAAAAIREAYPDIRLVAVLREPVSRLFSHYNMNVRLGFEPLDLGAAVEAEPARRAKGWGWDWHYAALGRYAPQLRRYYDLFPADQIQVLYYDELTKKPVETLRAICRHIGVDDDFTPDMSARGMVPYRPRSAALNRWLTWPNPLRERMRRGRKGRLLAPLLDAAQRWNETRPPRLDPARRAELAPLFAGDAEQVSLLTGRRPPWADVQAAA